MIQVTSQTGKQNLASLTIPFRCTLNSYMCFLSILYRKYKPTTKSLLIKYHQSIATGEHVIRWMTAISASLWVCVWKYSCTLISIRTRVMRNVNKFWNYQHEIIIVHCGVNMCTYTLLISIRIRVSRRCPFFLLEQIYFKWYMDLQNPATPTILSDGRVVKQWLNKRTRGNVLL